MHVFKKVTSRYVGPDKVELTITMDSNEFYHLRSALLGLFGPMSDALKDLINKFKEHDV